MNFFFFFFKKIQQEIIAHLAGAKKDESVLGHFLLRYSFRRKYTCNRYCSCSLNVVVEGTILVTIFIEKTKGVMITKVLELKRSVLIGSDKRLKILYVYTYILNNIYVRVNYLNENVLSVFLNARGHKFVDQFVVFGTSASRLVQTNVMRIVT